MSEQTKPWYPPEFKFGPWQEVRTGWYPPVLGDGIEPDGTLNGGAIIMGMTRQQRANRVPQDLLDVKPARSFVWFTVDPDYEGDVIVAFRIAEGYTA